MNNKKDIDLSNCAKRVLNILNQVRNSGDQLSTASVWQTAFGLKSADPYLIYQRLFLVRNELDLIEKKMIDKNISDELYKPYINQIRNIISSDNIAAPWSTYRHKLDGTCILSIKWCAELIEPEITANFGSLENLLSELLVFKENLEKKEIGGIVYEFVLNQINIIEQAINDYPIKGQEAIKKAHADRIVDIVEKSENVKGYVFTEKDQSKLDKLEKLWNSFNKATKGITDAYNRLKIIKEMCIENKETINNAGNLFLGLLDKFKDN